MAKMHGRTYSTDDVKAVILVGGRDFGRCSLATRLNRALWPVAGKPVLQHLIEHLAHQGVRRFVLSCEAESGPVRQQLQLPDSLDVKVIEEAMPRGTAGCIRDAAEPGGDELLFVFQACMLTPPDIRDVIRTHQAGDSLMTVLFDPAPELDAEILHDAQLYICEPSVLEFIPDKGYFDIKEGLVPALVAADKSIYAAKLAAPTGHYKHWRQYLQAAGTYLKKIETEQALPSGFRPVGPHSSVWAGENVQIAQSARFCGPVLIEADTRIESGAVILGPTLIGKHVVLGTNACVEQSVVWDNAVIGRDCHIRQSLVDQERNIPAGVLLDGILATQPRTCFDALADTIRLWFNRPARCPKGAERDGETLTLDELLHRPHFKLILAAMTGLLLAALLVSYWRPTLNQLLHIWLESDEYSSGLLVPFLAGYILWSRRLLFLDCRVKPAWAGLGLLLAAQALRFFGLYYMFASAERMAMVLSIGGIVLLLFGWAVFKRFVPTFLFLFLMLPLPNRVGAFVAAPLQSWATVSAVFSLETLGYGVLRQGNVIQIGDTLIAVAEACNGLRMLTAFFVISGFIALVSPRKLWENVVLLVSTIPIALICNTIRLTLTSIAFTILETKDLEKLFHDFGGLAMMPLAILIIVLELWILKHLFNPPETIEHQVVFSRK